MHNKIQDRTYLAPSPKKKREHLREHRAFSNVSLILMKKYVLALLLAALSTSAANAQGSLAPPQPPRPKVVVFYSVGVEYDHLLFAQQALQFFAANAAKDKYTFIATTDWDQLNADYLKDVKIMVWLDDEVHTPAQRTAFQQYMEHGGTWLGFHVSAYNDRNSQWTWFRSFLGGGAFGMNNWPPLPAKIVVDDTSHPVTKRLPPTFEAPSNEWYSWTPSPRLNPDVKVLLSLDKSNFPIGIKDVIMPTDVPIVWTNTKYKMLYMNIGHGDKIFTSDIQQNLIEDGLLWLLNRQQ